MALAMNLSILLCVLGVAMIGTFIYTILVFGHPFHKDVFTPWCLATVIECCVINGIFTGAWVSYKESSCVTALIWIIFLICFQSITVCVYIVLQISTLSAEEASLDPVYNVLIRRSSKNAVGTERCFSISAAKVFFVTLGCSSLGQSIWVLGKGFTVSNIFLEPWTLAMTVNYYISITGLIVWIIYKESRLISAFIWIPLLMVWGTLVISAYIVKELCYLSPQDPVYLILFNSSNRKSDTKKQLLGDIESA